jgi:hypothetical protein
MFPRGLRNVVSGLGLLVIAAVRPKALSQPRTLEVIVVDSLSQRALPNADVKDLIGGQRRVTDERGRAYLSWPGDGRMRLRVRQVGYTPQESIIDVRTTGSAARFAMQKLAYVVSGVQTKGRCTLPVDTTLLDVSVLALGQLQQAAQKYDDFRREYPFDAFVERRTVDVQRQEQVRRVLVARERYQSDNFDTEYRPGDVIKSRSGQFRVPLLLLSNLGDSVFWEHHCVAARGFHWYEGTRVVRLEFSATTDVRGPDYAGTATLDSATSMLLRVDFHLANTGRRGQPTRFEGYTTFASPSPFVMMPDSTVAIWWLRNPETKDWGDPDYAQSLHIDSLKYRRRAPPAYRDTTGTLSTH